MVPEPIESGIHRHSAAFYLSLYVKSRPVTFGVRPHFGQPIGLHNQFHRHLKNAEERAEDGGIDGAPVER